MLGGIKKSCRTYIANPPHPPPETVQNATRYLKIKNGPSRMILDYIGRQPERKTQIVFLSGPAPANQKMDRSL
jgi:hypothetical protein